MEILCKSSGFGGAESKLYLNFPLDWYVGRGMVKHSDDERPRGALFDVKKYKMEKKQIWYKAPGDVIELMKYGLQQR